MIFAAVTQTPARGVISAASAPGKLSQIGAMEATFQSLLAAGLTAGDGRAAQPKESVPGTDLASLFQGLGKDELQDLAESFQAALDIHSPSPALTPAMPVSHQMSREDVIAYLHEAVSLAGLDGTEALDMAQVEAVITTLPETLTVAEIDGMVVFRPSSDGPAAEPTSSRSTSSLAPDALESGPHVKPLAGSVQPPIPGRASMQAAAPFLIQVPVADEPGADAPLPVPGERGPEVVRAPLQPALTPAEQLAPAARSETVRPTLPGHVARKVAAGDMTDGRLRIELSPHGVGEMEIEVSRSEAGRLQVAVRAEQVQILHAIRNDRDLLAEALQSRGFQTDGAEFDFETFGDRGGRAPDRRAPADDADMRIAAEPVRGLEASSTNVPGAGIDIVL